MVNPRTGFELSRAAANITIKRLRLALAHLSKPQTYLGLFLPLTMRIYVTTFKYGGEICIFADACYITPYPTTTASRFS